MVCMDIVAKPKAKRRRKNLLKLKKGCKYSNLCLPRDTFSCNFFACSAWLSHVGSLLMLRCVQSALKRSHDYRESSEDTDWTEVRECVDVTAEDIRTVWFLINKEVTNSS